MIITAAQLRAARGLLDWTRTDLAKAANISPETVKNIEHGTFRPQEQTAEAIVKCFAMHDVEFMDNEGVQRRKDKVIKYEGSEGFRKFIDEVYTAAKDPSAAVGGDKPIYISCVDDRFFSKHLGEYLSPHIKRMNEIKDLKIRILIQDAPHTFTAEEVKKGSYREYKSLSDPLPGNVPFYVYGDKLAILIFEESKEAQIVVIASAVVSKAYRQQFDIIWKTAKPLSKAKA